MYARLKPFRCRHRPAGEPATSCLYHVTRGVPEQFLRSTTDMQLAEDAVSRDRLTTALKHAHQRKVQRHFTATKAAELKERKGSVFI